MGGANTSASNTACTPAKSATRHAPAQIVRPAQCMLPGSCLGRHAAQVRDELGRRLLVGLVVQPHQRERRAGAIIAAAHNNIAFEALRTATHRGVRHT